MTCLWRHLLSQVVELLVSGRSMASNPFTNVAKVSSSSLVKAGRAPHWLRKGYFIRRSSVARGIPKSFAPLLADTPELTARTASCNYSVLNFRRCFPMLKGSEHGKCRLEWQVIEEQKPGIKWKEKRVTSQLFIDVLPLYFCATFFALIFAIIQKFHDQ